MRRCRTPYGSKSSDLPTRQRYELARSQLEAHGLTQDHLALKAGTAPDVSTQEFGRRGLNAVADSGSPIHDEPLATATGIVDARADPIAALADAIVPNIIDAGSPLRWALITGRRRARWSRFADGANETRLTAVDLLDHADLVVRTSRRAGPHSDADQFSTRP